MANSLQQPNRFDTVEAINQFQAFLTRVKECCLRPNYLCRARQRACDDELVCQPALLHQQTNLLQHSRLEAGANANIHGRPEVEVMKLRDHSITKTCAPLIQ
jgi:hypothetical protein